MISNTEILNASILIVDDQDANVQLLDRLLGEAGYTRVSVDHGFRPRSARCTADTPTT